MTRISVGVWVGAAAVACTDSPTLVSKTAAATPPSKTFNPGSCGASFRIVTYEEDSLALQYGIPATQDTVDVCETWTGSDYTYSVVTVGSSENLVSVPDTVQITTYANGVETGLDAAGNGVNASQSSGGTLFDFMNADQTMRQASYDDPYYGIASASASGPLCDDPTYCPTGGSTNAKTAASAPSLSVVASPTDTAKWKRHGLTRRGVRAIVDDMDEIDAAPDGARRFRKMRGADEIILTVGRGTQLLVGEETRRADGEVTTARHTWRQAGGAWVKDRTDVYDEETAHGHTYRNHSVIQFLDVRLNPNARGSASLSRTP